LISIILLFVQVSCNSSPTKNTVAIVENFDAIWLLKGSLFVQPKLELNNELGFNQVIFIGYYIDSKDDQPFPRLSCPEAEARMSYYMEDKGIPAYFFNGVHLMKGVPNLQDDSIEAKQKAIKDELKKRIKSANQIIPSIKIIGQCNLYEKNTYQIKINIEVLEDIDFNNLQIVSILTESGIHYDAISSTKIHDFVFREYLKPKEIKDTIGIPIKLSKQGEIYKTEFTFELNKDLYKNQLSVVFFVQDMIQKNILQGVIVPLVFH
jgi:hypothetical protein